MESGNRVFDGESPLEFFDLPTAAIALAGLIVIWRFRLPEPLEALLSG